MFELAHSRRHPKLNPPSKTLTYVLERMTDSHHGKFHRSRMLSSSNSRLLTDPRRSALMARVRQKGTSPELVLQGMLRRLGISYSTNNKSLPGSPDIVDLKKERVLFVHGCFWHRHRGCPASTTPTRNAVFWQTKFDQNVARDARNVRRLRQLRMRILTVWECQLKNENDLARVEKRLHRFFAMET